MDLTRQGVRNLDLIKVIKPIATCNGKTGCTPSKWKKEGIYPNAAFEHDTSIEDCFRAGTVEVMLIRFTHSTDSIGELR
jgi:hypothetical protein